MTVNRITAAVLCIAVAAALLWCFFGWMFRGGGNGEARRWKSIETPFESDLFKDLAKPSAPPAGGKLTQDLADWTRPNIAVYSASLPLPPHLTLRDLDDNAQVRAIDFLAQNSPSSPHSWNDLREALVDDSVSAGADPFHFNRVLVATVTKGTSWDPGDRMVWTRVFVQPINFKFAGYTVAATENETVKIASIAATSSRKFSAALGLTVPGVKGPTANISPSEEHAVTSTANITEQYERLGVDILPNNFLRIIRESETGGDVVGNTTVSLSIVTDPVLIRNKYPGDTHPTPIGDDLVLAITAMHLDDADDNASSLTLLPQAQMPHCPLLARVWMLYAQRQIVTGREFYRESQQTVRIVRDAVRPTDVTIINADDVAPVWFIQIVGNDQKNANGRVQILGARLTGGQYRALVFADYDQASKLASWVRQRSGRPLKDRSFNYPDGASLVPWKLTEDECDNGRSAEVYQKPDSQ
jgi:hypothetical protein